MGSKTESITPSYKLAVTYQGEPARCADELISETLSTEDPGSTNYIPPLQILLVVAHRIELWDYGVMFRISEQCYVSQS